MVLATSSPVSGASQPPQDCLPEPLLLPWDLRLTPEQFALVCQANPEAVLELAADGSLIVMTPTGGETGSRNGEIGFQLRRFCRSDPRWRMFDSSSGFRLPDDSILSPDAALVAEGRWQALTPEQRRGFPPLCPDLVLELVSPSDEGPRGLTALRRKMAAFQRNGATLGLLLLPQERAVEVWRAGAEDMAERLENPTWLEAGEPFEGLTLELEPIWSL
jgi:Uma2 family endonuclease